MKKIENKSTGLDSISLVLDNNERRILLDVQTSLNNKLKNLQYVIEMVVHDLPISERDSNEVLMQFNEMTAEWEKINTLLGNYTAGIKTSKELAEDMFTSEEDKKFDTFCERSKPGIVGKIRLV